jgi:hypothetical protein
VCKPAPLPDGLRKHGAKAMELYQTFAQENDVQSAAAVNGEAAGHTFATGAKTAHLEKMSFEECLKLYFPRNTLKPSELQKLAKWVKAWQAYNKEKAEWLASLRPEQRALAIKALKAEGG